MKKIFKHQNSNGTFTYSDEAGKVIIAASKRDFEYGCFPIYFDRTFGKYSTCEKAIKEAAKRAANDIKYCEEVIAYKNGSGKKPYPYYKSMEEESIEHYQIHIEAIKNKLSNTSIIKIESI